MQAVLKFIRCFLYSLTRRNIMVHVRGSDIDYITLKKANERWGVSARQRNYYCATNRIPGAVKMATLWFIPRNTKYPVDGRLKQVKEAM